MEDRILEFQHISKDFSGVSVLQDVSFDVQRGSCHCLIGENGAGKSTLIKILTGVYTKSGGEILYNGEPFAAASTRESYQKGIACVFQELNMVDSLTIEENMTLGRENTKAGVLRKTDNDAIRKALDFVSSELDPKMLAGMLSFAQKQMVEIAKAVNSNAKIIILDEPTAALSEEEVNRLFSAIRSLKKHGVTILYISHRLEELFLIGDRITVLRDGCFQGTLEVDASLTRSELIRLMTGKTIAETYVPNPVDRNRVVFEAEGLTNAKIHNVSFQLYKSEVLGIYGLVGAGKSEIARAIYGADSSEGVVRIEGKPFEHRNPEKSISNGLVLIPEERRLQGLCTELTITDNVPMMDYSTVRKNRLFSQAKAKQETAKYVELLRVMCRSVIQNVVTLSGGNQQKVVIAKCLNARPQLMMLDEPTRGVDVGAKQEIYTIIRKLSSEGSSVMVFSSELPEILNLCDRIILIHDGEIKAILDNDKDIDSQKIMHIVTGGSDSHE